MASHICMDSYRIEKSTHSHTHYPRNRNSKKKYSLLRSKFVVDGISISTFCGNLRVLVACISIFSRLQLLPYSPNSACIIRISIESKSQSHVILYFSFWLRMCVVHVGRLLVSLCHRSFGSDRVSINWCVCLSVSVCVMYKLT